MTNSARRLLPLILVVCFGFAIEADVCSRESSPASRPQEAAKPSLRPLPLDFVENRGQWDSRSRFVAGSGTLKAGLEPDAIVLQAGTSRLAALRLVFERAAANVRVVGEQRRQGVYNFFLGNDAVRWRSQVPAYGAVRYEQMYTGIDIRIREGSAGILEYDVLVAPHADLSDVVIRADGAQSIDVRPDGTLVIETAEGSLRQRAPTTWEELPNGEHRPVRSRFRRIDDRRYGFEALTRDSNLPLVVDPGLEWSTFLGGSGPEFMGPAVVARDGTGDVFVGGVMKSPDFPLFSEPDFVIYTQDRAFVARLSASGSELRYASFFGGWHSQIVRRGLAVDVGGNAVLVGQTFSPDFPTTAGAFDRVGLHKDGFVVRLNPTGGLIFSTFLGGFGEDDAVAVAYDPAGNIVVGGNTVSADFPTTPDSFDPSYNVPNAPADGGAHGDMFVARLTPDGSALTYSTFIGGPQADVLEDLVIDSNGFVTIVGWVTGNNVQTFVTTPGAFDRTWNGSQDAAIARLKLDGAGSADLKYATLFGGAGQDNLWIAAIDPLNPELVTFAGRTWSNDYPVTPGVVRPTNPPFSELFPEVEAGIITRFRFPTAGGGSLMWSTHHHSDRITGLAVNADGEPIVVGPSAPYDMPTTRGAFEVVADGPGSPGGGFIGRLNATATQYVYQSFFGGTVGLRDLYDISPQVKYFSGNTVIVSGQTASNDFPITPSAADPVSSNPSGVFNEGFVTKITLDADASGDVTAAAPTLLSPPDGVTYHNGYLGRLEWTAVTDPSGVETYEFQVAARADFAKNFIGHRGGIAETEVLIPPSVGNSGGLSLIPWFWRVRTADRAGNLSAWSAVRSFTISGTTGQPTVSGIGVFPPSGISSGVPGGALAVGTIHLFKAAPAGGLVARLTAHHNRSAGLDRLRSLPIPVTVPELVNIAEGALTASFEIQTSQVTEVTGVSLVATVNGIGGSGSLSLMPDAGPKSGTLTILPAMLTGGTPATGTVTVSPPAPAGGTVVGLMSSHAAAARVPASVLVPAGAQSVTFPISTSPVPTETDVRIVATSGTATWAWDMHVRPANLPRLTSMTLSPASVTGGDQSGGTLTFSGPIPLGTWPAQQDGKVAYSSSDPDVAAMYPFDGWVLAGTASHSFGIYTLGVPQTRTVTLSAHFDGVTLSRPITVNALTGVTVSSLTSNVTTLRGGEGGLLTVRLAAPAPVHTLVTISTNRPDLVSELPRTVVVSAGSTSALVPFVMSASITSPTAVSITAAYGSSSASIAFNVSPSPGTSPPVVGLTLSPSTVVAGSGSTGTVTLHGPAPAGGALVTLFGGSPASVPANVTVLAGATTATFPISTTSATSDTSVVITALLHLSFGTTLTVRAGGGAQPTLSGLSLSPSSVTGGTSSTGTVTLSSAAPSGGSVVALSSSNTAAATVPSSVTVTAGTTSRTFTVTTQTVASSTSSTITGTLGTTRTATLTVNAAAPATPAAPSLVSPSNGASVALPLTLDWNDVTAAASYQIHIDDSSSFSTPRVVDQTLTVSQFTATSLAARQHWWRVRGRNSAGTAGSWSSVRSFTPQSTPAPVALSAVSVTPSSVVGGNGSQGTVTLTSAAPAGGFAVSLSSSNTAAATVPVSVTVAQGATTATFAIGTSAVTTSTPVTISTSAGTVTRTATLTVTPVPPPASLQSLSVTPTSVTGGTGATGTVTLTSGAPTGGAVVSLSSSNTAAANVPASVTVAAGAPTATFAVTTAAVGASTPVTISAVHNSVTRTTTLTVNPPAQTATLTVTATGRSGERITSNPAGINVLVGSTGSASFNVGTSITLSVTNGRDAIWSGACSSGGNKTRNCTFTLSANGAVTANVQ